MVLKRHICEDGAESGAPIRESKRQVTFPSSVREVVKGLALHEVVSELEPFVQRVVREEVEQAIIRFLRSAPRPSLSHSDSFRTRAWQLLFDKKVPSTLFTGCRIESEDSKPIRIVIVDACLKKIISSGPPSSVKVEICVLDGDFGADDQEDWTDKEFNANIVREREGKRPLLTGDRVITLKDGVGYINEISFTDNSSWIRSRRFRLGVRVLHKTTSELRIREARSEAFVVKDQRGESYRKHHPPYLGDEIWRLERIAKDGPSHKKLADNKISTVKDFLRLYVTNRSALRSVLGGITNKIWETVTEHAMTCILDHREFYLYYIATERMGIVLNSIYKVVGATFDGQNFQSVDKLTSVQMQVVKYVKQHAHRNLQDLVPIDDQSIIAFLGQHADPPNTATLDLHQSHLPVEELDEFGMLTSFNHMPAPPLALEVEDSNRLEVPMAHNFHPIHSFDPTSGNSVTMRNFCSGSYDGGNCWATSGSLVPVVQPGRLAGNDTFHAEPSTWLPVSASWGQESGLQFGQGSGADMGMASSFPSFGFHLSRNGKSKAGWCKLRAAVKWKILARRTGKARLSRLLKFSSW